MWQACESFVSSLTNVWQPKLWLCLKMKWVPIHLEVQSTPRKVQYGVHNNCTVLQKTKLVLYVCVTSDSGR